MEPAAGTQVTRNVKLVRPLGKGGMGSVWIGEHTTLDTEVAVKFIAPEHAEKQRFVARFRREASSAAKIKSPHVVQVFDHGVTDDGIPYIVMELLEGEPLSRRLRRGPLSAREAAMLVSQVSKVLTIAHDLGIVHRDLKPDNLYLVESGYELFVKVLDFGIAKQLAGDPSEITDTGAMVGTPYYMSPEMLLSPKDADRRADLWALAVVAYHALTGVLPFSGETLAALSVAINEGGFRPPSALVPELGPEVDVWFKLALCRNLTGRFSSAADLALGFRQALMDSNEVSGDRTSHPLDSDSLPETARPSNVSVKTLTSELERAPTLVTPNADGAAAGSSTAATADRTVTSEQLAKIHDSPAVLAAVPTDEGQSTLEGTASNGEASSPPWKRRIGVAAVALVAVAAVGMLMREPETAPAPGAAPESTSPTPSVASSSVRAPEPPPPSPAPAGEESAPVTAAPSAKASTRAPSPLVAAPPLPLPPPRVAPKPSVKPPVSCKNPFIVDANGDLQPRPGCF